MKKILSGGLIIALLALTVWANLPAVNGQVQVSQQIDDSNMALIVGGGLFGCLVAIVSLTRGIATICMGAIFWGSFTVTAALLAMVDQC